MKILVCVKQVCDSADTLDIKGSGRWFDYGKETVFRMNRYDEYALEEALRIKEERAGTTVDALSVGPERVQATIRRSMGMGADHGMHILRDEDIYLSPIERASLIAAAIRDRGYDLILAGVMAEDDMEGQVGGLLAALLGYVSATGVIDRKSCRNMGYIEVEREIEGGCREGLTLKLPAVLTIQSGINTPRYPSLSHMLRARTASIESIDLHACDVMSFPQSFAGITRPMTDKTGEFLQGTPGEKARRLLEILHDHALILGVYKR